jgi:ABC-type transport system involved in cytochrome c biogenesis permease subunit
MAWVGTLAFLVLLRRARLTGLVVLVAPMAFLGVFFGRLGLQGPFPPPGGEGGGALPHAHVLLASAGLSLLGLAGLAGVLYLLEHRRLKAKRPLDGRLSLPSLEALDRVNAAALALGFPLLTLGVITGSMWAHALHQQPFSATLHETWTLLAWGIYGVLVSLRFGAHQGARQCAASAIAGFAFLVFAVVGVELLA